MTDEQQDERELSAVERRYVLALSGVSERSLRRWQRYQTTRRGTEQRLEEALAQIRSGQPFTVNLEGS